MNEDNVSYTDIEAMNLTTGIPPRDFKTHHLTPRPYNKSNTLSKLVQQQLIHTWGTMCQRVEWTELISPKPLTVQALKFGSG